MNNDWWVMMKKSLIIVAVYAKDSIGTVLYVNTIPSVMARLLLYQILSALLNLSQLGSLTHILISDFILLKGVGLDLVVLLIHHRYLL